MNAVTPIRAAQAPRRGEVLAFIIDEVARYGISPSYADIANHLGVSRSRAGQYVKQLVAMGEVAHTPGSQRGLRVIGTQATAELMALRLKYSGWTLVEPVGAGGVMMPVLRLMELPATDTGLGAIIAALE